MPVYKIVVDACWGLYHALEALVKDRKGIRHVKEGHRLLFGKYLVYAMVYRFTLFDREGAPAFQQKTVHFIVLIGNEIEFAFFGL
ncbi:MAG: hypothetical protein HQL08_16635, partial [Nitrospirae bacterium]|nr:hypothetical protein [Nitrospirota bacterium]